MTTSDIRLHCPTIRVKGFFGLYQGILYGFIETDWAQATGQWNIMTGEFSLDRATGHFSPAADLAARRAGTPVPG